MRELTNPILRDALRVIQRSPDLSPAFKTRLAEGLSEVDEELRVAVEVQTDRASERPPKKGRR